MRIAGEQIGVWIKHASLAKVVQVALNVVGVSSAVVAAMGVAFGVVAIMEY